jgi:hypothetical protein
MLWLLVTGIIILFIISILIALVILAVPVQFHFESCKSEELFNISIAVSWLILKTRCSFKDRQIEVLLFNRRLTAVQPLKKPREAPVKKQQEVMKEQGIPEKIKKAKKFKISKITSKQAWINSFLKKHGIYSRIFNKIKRLVSPENITLFTGFIGPGITCYRGIIRTFKFKYIKIDTTYGMNDPAHTGIITGFIHTILGPFPTGTSISFNPVFTGPVLDWDMKTHASFTPVHIIAPIIRFATNWQVIRSTWGIIRC